MSKKLREEDLVLNIIVNGKQSHKEMGEVARKMRDANVEVDSLVKQQKELERQGKRNTAEYRALSEQIAKGNAVVDNYRAKIKELGESMKLSDKSIHQLKQSLTQLNKLKNQAVPGSAQYKEYEQRIQVVNARLTELGVRSRQTGTALQNMGTNFTRYLGVISAGIASFVAATMGIRKAIDEYARFDDKMADVQKTTDLSKESVKELNAELEKLDTRTSQEDLLGLARIGGKLGLTDLEELRGFVSSSNQIIVALNEDLGGNVEETINTIGKLVSVFGVKEEFGIEKSILKVGSAINELGMASEANEGKIVDFANRMAGIAPLANISIEEILGLGATLDQFAQSPEVAGTALNKLFLNMAKDAKTYSKYAGMDIISFKDLLEKDFMGAFKKVLEGVKDNSKGVNELAATLGDLGVDGQRVIGVIGTLANQHEVLTENIELSQKASEEATSVSKEYALKNETAAAKLEKVRKEVSLLWRQLGEKLWPAMTTGNSILVMFIDLLIKLITFISNNIKWISALAAGFVAYQTAVLASTVAVKAARIATLAFNAAVRANPIMGFIALLTAVGVALYNYSRQLTTTQAIQESFNETNKQAQKDSLAERLEIERNQKVLASETAERDEKLDAIRRLRNIMPDVLKDYDDEKILAGKATKAIQDQTKAILEQAQQRAYANKITQLTSDKIDIEDKLSKGWGGASIADKGIARYLTPRFKKSPEEVYLEKVQNELKNKEAEIEKFSELIYGKERTYGSQTGVKKMTNPFAKEQSTIDNEVKYRSEGGGAIVGDGDGGGGGDKPSDASSRAKEKLDAELEEWKAQLSKENEFADKQLLQLEKKYKELIKLSEGDGAKQKEITETYEKLEWQRQLEIMEEGAEKYRKRQLDEMDLLYAEMAAKDKEKYLADLIAIDQMDASEEERRLMRDQINLERDELEKEREAEKLNARWLLLEHFENFGDLEIEEAQRVADEKARIESQIVDNAIAEAQRLAKEKEELAEAQIAADKAIQEATAEGYQAGFALMKDLFKENKALANLFLVMEKTAAAAHIITNLQKEIASYHASMAFLGLPGAAVATKMALAAKIRAGASLATIASQTIQGVSSNNAKSDSSAQRMPGREKGGAFVQRSQDGKMFKASVEPNRRGYIQKPTVLVGENGNEFVANAQAVANPSVKAFLDIIDVAQRNGSISTLSLQNVMNRSGSSRVRGYESGGYVGSQKEAVNTSSQQINFNELNKTQKELAKVVDQLQKQIRNGITAEVSLLGRNGLNEKQKELESIKNQAEI